jgi:tripartite-type tricarboxylate transporter receptor subunit TctC
MNSKQAKTGGAVAILFTLAACSNGQEDPEEYPGGAVTIVVPVPAGSSTDLSTRILAPCLEDELGETVLVENHEGGSGAVGNTYFTQADPDGYTLVSTTAANAVLPPLLEDGVQFDADSFLPLGTIGQAPIVMVVPDDSAYETAEELLAAAESERLLVGVPGATSVPAIVAGALIEDHGLAMETVPFDGNGNTIQALRSGDVDVAYVSADSGVTVPRLQDNEIRALATAVTEPASHLPDVPPLESLGYTDLPYGDSFWFLAAQPDTPEPVVDVLEAAMETGKYAADVKEQLGDGVAPEHFVDGTATREHLQLAQESYAEAIGGE